MTDQGKTSLTGPWSGSDSLFRRQVARGNRLAAPGQICPPLAGRVLAWTSLAASLALLSLLWIGSYSGRQRVEGYLADAESVLAVDAGREGTISRIMVRPGQSIRQGQALFTVSGEHVASDGASPLSSQIRALENQLASLAERTRLIEAAWLSRRQSMQSSTSSLDRQLEALAKQQDLLQERVARRTVDSQRSRQLLEQGHIARAVFDLALERQTEAALALQGLVERVEAVSDRRKQLLLQLDSEQARVQMEHLELRATGLQLQAELDRLHAQRETLALAPRAGMVGDLRASIGSSVRAGETVLTVYSGHEPVVANLAVPTQLMPVFSQSLGIRLEIEDSLDPGRQPLEARVLEVSATPLTPGDAFGPMRLRYAAYRVRVAISARSLESVRSGLLLPNRQVTAVLVGPPRPLLHWILQPLRDLSRAVS